MQNLRRHATTDLTVHPRYVVWELTLKCDLACRHCGSRAGKARKEELSLEESKQLIHQLVDMGTREITFIGGEAYLHPDWLEIVRETARSGIRATMTTGGRKVDACLANQAANAGMAAMSVSIDGLETTHDRLRAVPGSFKAAMEALGYIRAAGMISTANTQWNRLNLPELESLAEILFDQQISAWQVQLTGPMGRAADRQHILLQPYEMLDLVPRLAAVAERGAHRGIAVHAANNLGYFGPYERILRSVPWQGCVAGRYTLGIESNGDIKGCPSLPSKPYVGGNIRHRSLRDLWENTVELAFARERTTDELWGHCRSCYYADVCKGGCSWTAHTLLGRRGNLPYCYHRAETLAEQGIRERLIQTQAAPGQPFDFGQFELLEEAIPTLEMN